MDPGIQILLAAAAITIATYFIVKDHKSALDTEKYFSQRIKDEIAVIGGEKLTLRLSNARGRNEYVVSYVDEFGIPCSHVVWQCTGRNDYRIHWEPPLIDLNRASSSKEEIISTLTAEIDVLKKKLDKQSGDSAENNK